VSVDVARADWESAFRRLEAERANTRRYRELLLAVEAVTDELRARVGQTFTLDQLADAYASVERWGREAVANREPYDDWSRDLALIEDAAFSIYSRNATDYSP
jgi:hypothetical protein